jgi:hypothetical protein
VIVILKAQCLLKRRYCSRFLNNLHQADLPQFAAQKIFGAMRKFGVGQNSAALFGQIVLEAETPQGCKRTSAMKTQRRWLKSVITASAAPALAMPWTRGQRRKPLALQVPAVKASIAAR